MELSLQEGWNSGRSLLLPRKDFANPGITRISTPVPVLRGLWEPTLRPAPGTLVYPSLQNTPGAPRQSSGHGSGNISSCPGIGGQRRGQVMEDVTRGGLDQPAEASCLLVAQRQVPDSLHV